MATSKDTGGGSYFFWIVFLFNPVLIYKANYEKLTSWILY